MKMSLRKRTRVRGRGGFTLLELMLVMAILVLLSSLAIVGVMRISQGAKKDAAATQIASLKNVCKMFKLRVGRYPATLNELVALPSGMNQQQWQGPYLDEGNLPSDPWGHPYTYAANESTDIVQITSVGADGQQGTADDVGNVAK